MPTNVRELLARLDRSAFVWDNKLNELWAETRAVIEAAHGFPKDCELGIALAAWIARAEEVLR